MRNNELAIIGLSQCISLGLQISSIFIKDWSKTDSKHFSLFSCTNCNNLYKDYTWECMARTNCYSNSDTCELYENGYQGEILYLYLELASIIFGSLFLEKIVFFILGKAYGTRKIVILLLILHYALHIGATLSWFLLTGATFQKSKLVASTGPIIAIVTCIWETVNISFYVYRLLNYEDIIEDEDFESLNNFFRISPKVFSILSFLFGIIGSIFIFIGISNESWIKTPNFIGSLLRCKDCDEVPWLMWQCLSGTSCSTDKDSESCDLYKSLSQSSFIFLTFEVLSFYFFLLSTQMIEALIISRSYGFPYLIYVTFKQIYSFLAFAFNLSASVSYTIISSIKTLSCDTDPCAQSGFAYPVASCFFYFMYFVCITIARKRTHIIPYSSLTAIKSMNFSTKNFSLSVIEEHHNEEPEEVEIAPCARANTVNEDLATRRE